jgi:hypothetical protein
LGDDSNEKVEREGDRCWSTDGPGANRWTPGGRGMALTEWLDVVDGRDMLEEVDLLAECGMTDCVGASRCGCSGQRMRRRRKCLFVAGNREFLSGTGSLP